MLVQTKAIVISSIRYQDKNLIVRCFTQDEGVKSYFVRNAFSSKSAQRKIAYFQPLNLLQIQAVHKNKGTLENFKEVGLSAAYQSINTQVVKGTLVMFLSEILQFSLKDDEKNPELFHYLESALLWLDQHDHVANFHLIVMLQMTRYLGFYPDNSQSEAPYFDLVDGIFTHEPSYNSLPTEQTRLLARLLSLSLTENDLVFSASQRRNLLQILTNYYAQHLEGFRSPKSLEVLQEIFS